MRKSIVILLILVIVSSGLTIYGGVKIYKAHDQVAVTEQVIYGDPSAAKGLKATLRTTYDDHLFWETTQVLGTAKLPETEYEFFTADQRMPYRHNYQGIYHYMNYVPNSYFYDMEGTPEGLPAAYKELFEETSAGQEKEKTVLVKDYLDYYPLETCFDFDGTTFSLQSDYTGSTFDHYLTGTKDAIKVFNNYFKIPVLPDEKITISVNKSLDGSYAGDGMSNPPDGNYYSPQTVSAIGSNRCFFTIPSHSARGQQMDMSLLPDGYGIFCFDFKTEYFESGVTKGTRINQDSFRNAYPLDPSVMVCSMIMNQEKTVLYLFTMEEGYYWFTAIDTETYETKSRMQIAPLAPKDSYGPTPYDCGDFIAVFMHSVNKVAVITVSPSGEYNLAFVSEEISSEEQGIPYLTDPALAFDGKRLAAACSGFMDEAAVYSLLVFTADGLQYWGDYNTSLNTGIHKRNNYGYNVRPLDYDSMSLEWVN